MLPYIPVAIPIPVLSSIFIVSIWVVYFQQLSFEWYHNAQYTYGLWIPFIGMYLLYLRYQAAPRAVPNHNATILGICALYSVLLSLLYIPIKIIFISNVDWRLLLWIQGILNVGMTLLWIYTVGGGGWVKHFGSSILFLLVAIPWPKGVELWIIQSLMQMVLKATHMLLSFSGIYACVQGNYIRLESGIVHMQEGCSGIRSLQSTVMLGCMLGELFRLCLTSRCFLVLSGSVLAIILNSLRAFTFSVLTHYYGHELVLKYHDLIGYCTLISTLVIIYIIADWLKEESKPKLNVPIRFYFKPGNHPYLYITACLGIIVSYPIATWWYRPPLNSVSSLWTVNWNALKEPITFEPIPTYIQQTLCTDAGTCVCWKDLSKNNHMGYFFTWPSDQAAQIGGFHAPDLCLPTQGWELQKNSLQTLKWETAAVCLYTNAYTFLAQDQKLYVFYCQWDQSAYPFHKKNGRTRTDRLIDAFKGARRSAKRSLELIISGPESFEHAYVCYEHFLEQTISVAKESL